MEKNNRDIFASDVAFLSFGGAMLTGMGLVMVILALICMFGGGGGLCNLQFLSFPRLGGELQLINQEFVAINLPLGMLIIGIGLQLFNRLGWTVSFVILLIFFLIFGLAVYAHLREWWFMGMDYIYLPSAVLQSCFLLLIMGTLFIFYPLRLENCIGNETINCTLYSCC